LLELFSLDGAFLEREFNIVTIKADNSFVSVFDIYIFMIKKTA
jgi:hypothetical protein